LNNRGTDYKSAPSGRRWTIGFAYKELPPRVEYKLSEKGLAFLPILEAIKEWQGKFEIMSIVNSN